MRNEKRRKLEELRTAGGRRVLDAIRLVSEEMSDFEEDDIPEMPAGVLMKGRPQGGGHPAQ